MAGEEIKDVLLRIRADSSGLEQGTRAAKSSIIELNQSVELLKSAMSLAGGAYEALSGALARGESVTQISTAFENLNAKVGLLADQQLSKLRTAIGGTVSDLQLMEQANKAMLLGLDATQLDSMAAAAVKLGAAVGRTGTESFQDLVTGVGRGSALILDNLGVIVDTEAAYDSFAKKVGKTADQLSEAGKKAAFQEAAFTAIAKSAESLAAPADTAGKAFERLKALVENTGDKALKAANESSSLASAIQSISDAIANIDESKMTKILSFLGGVASFGVSAITTTGKGIGTAIRDTIDDTFNLSDVAQYQDAVKNIAQLQEKLKLGGDKGAAFLGGSSSENLEKQIKSYESIRDSLLLIHRDLPAQQQQFNSYFDSLTGSVLNTGQKVVKLKDEWIDHGKAAEASSKAAAEASKKALDGFIAEGREFQNWLDNQPIIGKNNQVLDYTFGEKALKESFQNSVNFFGDLLTPMFEGQAANFEDIFLDAAKRIAIGFGSQLLANVTASLGFGGIGGIGDAAGLGKALASSLGFGGGGQKGLEDFIGPLAPGSGVLGLINSSGVISFGGAAGVAAGGAVGALQVQGAQSVLKGGDLSFGQQAALALPTFGASFLYNPVKNALGFGDSEKSQEREQREALLNSLFEGGAQFGGTRGSITLDPSKFNASGKFGGQGTALVNPLAQILTGGDDKAGSDLAGIFENGVTSGENFNETIVNTLALMDQLNINAEDAKPQLAELFLDGKVSLDEFSTGIANLNILATENLVGEGSVADAIGIMSSELATPRQQLKGLELAFKEMSEIGIDTSSEIHDYLSEHFSPDVVAVFDEITAAGIDTFQEVAEAGPDSLVSIFGPLSELKKEFEDTAKVAADFGNTDSSRVIDDLRTARKEAKELTAEYGRLTKARREFEGSGGYNPNQANNVRPEG